MKEIISALSKALNVAESDLSSGLLDGEKIKDGAEKFLSDKLADHYKKVTTEAKAESKEENENQVKKVRKETAEKFEKVIKTAVTGIDQTLIGDQLLEALPKQITKIATAGAEDPAKILSSEAHIKALKDAEEKIKADYDKRISDKEAELAAIKSASEKKELNERLLAEAAKVTSKLVIRDDVPAEAVATIRKAAEQQLLTGRNYKVLETGDIIIVKEDGSPDKDKHGNLIKLEDVITEAMKPLMAIAKAGEHRGDGGNGGSGGSGSVTFESLGLTKPKTLQDHQLIINKTVELVNSGKMSKEQQTALVAASKKSVVEESTKTS